MGEWDSDEEEWGEESPAKSPPKASPTENSSEFVKLEENQGEYSYVYIVCPARTRINYY